MAVEKNKHSPETTGVNMLREMSYVRVLRNSSYKAGKNRQKPDL
jgi:hypothetical protein